MQSKCLQPKTSIFQLKSLLGKIKVKKRKEKKKKKRKKGKKKERKRERNKKSENVDRKKEPIFTPGMRE